MRCIHFTPFRYNIHVVNVALQRSPETGLIYRVRRGAAHGPLVVMIHGLGGDENVMWVFDRAIPTLATAISPRAPIQIEAGLPYEAQVQRGYSWVWPAPAGEVDHADLAAAIDLMRRFVGEAVHVYEIDPRKVILMGFSQGAALVYALSLAAPELISGAIALAGFLPAQSHPERNVVKSTGAPASTPLRAAQHAVQFPRHGYLIIHGLEDDAVPIAEARRARSILESIGAPVEYHEYPIGHKLPAQGMQDITQWLNRMLAL